MEGEESGTKITVSNASVELKIDRVKTLLIKDDGKHGEVSHYLSFLGIKLPLPPFRKIAEVGPENPDGRIWNSRDEHMTVVYEAPSEKVA